MQTLPDPTEPTKPVKFDMALLKLDTLPDITAIDLQECFNDNRLVKTTREFALGLLNFRYSAVGCYFYNINPVDLKLLYEYVQAVPEQIRLYKEANISLRELDALYNIMMLTYLFARAEGEIDMDNLDFNQIKYTCFAIQLVYLQSVGKAVANITNFTVLPNNKFPEMYGSFGELLKAV